jgi:hypothetical protein
MSQELFILIFQAENQKLLVCVHAVALLLCVLTGNLVLSVNQERLEDIFRSDKSPFSNIVHLDLAVLSAILERQLNQIVVSVDVEAFFEFARPIADLLRSHFQ